MFKYRYLVILLPAVILLSVVGCTKQTITDKAIIDNITAWMDQPQDPSDEWTLAPEERAAVESFEVYRNTLKLQLVTETNHDIWEPIGKKFAHQFAMASRELSYHEAKYNVELYIMVTVDDETFNGKAGVIAFDNASERLIVELMNPESAGRYMGEG